MYKELSPVDELEFFNPFDETHPMKFKTERKNVAAGYYRARRWSACGVPRRCCTTTRWENLLAIPRSRSNRHIQRRDRKIALAGKAPLQRFDLANAKPMRTAFAQRICAETALSV